MTYEARQFDFEGIPVSYLESGRGFPILMIHGSGPGASTQGNWRAVLGPLAERFHIFAMDLIGFGQSGRKAAPPYFDYDLWFRQCRAMIAQMPGPAIGIIGHSLSAALALKLAGIEHRIAKVLTTGAMGAHFPVNEWTLRTWTFPATRDDLRRAAEGLVYDKSLIDDAYLEGRERVLHAGDYREYFGAMFSGDRQRFVDAAVLSPEELGRVGCDVALLHGRDDRAFPAEPLSVALARAIPQADLFLIGRCSHSVAMEHPSHLLAVGDLLFR